MRGSAYKFEDFYRAFGRSVSADVVFADGEVHIVPHDPVQLVKEKLAASNADQNKQTQMTRSQSDSRLEDGDRQLPEYVAALLELQEPDGSWKFTDAFRFVLNGVAPEPVNGISSKLWATAIALSIWRQAPEYFSQLEFQYSRAVLHADESVIKVAKEHLDLSSLHKVRYYRSEEARALREQQIRQAAAQRQQEDAEYEAAKRQRELEEEVMELSIQQARRLPADTQKLMVSAMESEIESVFNKVPYEKGLEVGACVECCYRRLDGGATRAVKHSQWFPCRITFVDRNLRTAHVEFLDGDFERARHVPFKFLRCPLTEQMRARKVEFDKLRDQWLSASSFEDEVNRLKEIEAKNSQREPWSSQVNCDLVSYASVVSPVKSTNRSLDELEPRPRSRSRPLIVRPPSCSLSSRQVLERQQIDKLFQAAADCMVAYDRAFAHTCATARACCKKYAMAVLYRERFHAFDDFGGAMKELAEVTADTLDAVRAWKQRQVALGGKAARAVSFIWDGKDFTHTVARSLDFFGDLRELVEWYGEEFPFEMNPFLLSDTLIDKAEDLGLVVAQDRKLPGGQSIQAALRLHKKEVRDSSQPPTWWPEFQYPPELRRRIESAEDVRVESTVPTIGYHWFDKGCS